MIILRRLAASHYKGLIDVSLRLPERGSVLIEGRNEAGKSTLFDAMHFGLYGRPLVGDQPDAIHYGADQAVVELDLQVDNTELKLRRALRQTAKTLRAEAELEVRRQTGQDPADVEVEQVKGAAAVNSRLQLELGGLTAEALLNSCLVAQKQLGRLEDLARSSREAALTVLLNLGKLSDVHQRLRVKPEDEEQLRRARARVELARLAEQLATLNARWSELERARRLAELRAALDELLLVSATRGELERESERLSAQLAEVRAELGEADRLRGELAAWERVSELTVRAESLERERQEIEARLAALAKVEQTLPAQRGELAEAQALRTAAQALLDARAESEALRRESERLTARIDERAELTARCGRLDSELTHLRRQHRDLQAQIQQLAPLTAELEASRSRQRELAALRRDVTAAQEQRAAVDALEQRSVRVGELLTRWIELRRQEEAAELAKRLLEDLALGVAGVEPITAGQGAAEHGLRLRLLVDHPLTGSLALQLRLWPGGGELSDVRAVSAKEAERLQTSGVPTLSAGGLEEARRERRAVGRELEDLGERPPADLGEAERRLAGPRAAESAANAARSAQAQAERCLERARALRLELPDGALDTLDALPLAIAATLHHESDRQAELSVAAGRREGLQGQIILLERNGKERKRELEECQTSLGRDDDETLAAQRRETEERAAETDQRAAALETQLSSALGTTEAPREAAQRRVDALAAEVAVGERQLADRDALSERAKVLKRSSDELASQLEVAVTAAGGGADEAAQRIAALRTQLDRIGEAALRLREQELQRAAGAIEARQRRAEEDARVLAAAGVRLAVELGHAIEPERVAEAVPIQIPEALGPLPARAEIEQQTSALAQERGALERGMADARAALGSEAPVPLAEASERLERLEEQVAARRRGQEIVLLTRQRMINKVLPDTINNMCVLLPQLTADRYRYAELTPEYKLQVWDERAKAYVEKSLFSGGTQDQFSLALRLGFALAALPRELGTSPGFLFLDEPLSSFDRDRSEALVTLLTRGQVATFFRQVLLISHSQAFDPTLFTHHVLMEHGRVAESTLP